MARGFREGREPKLRNHLIGESWHDCTFIDAVAKRHGVPAFDYSVPLGDDLVPLGKSGFKRQLLAVLPYVNVGIVKNIVVVADNDTDHVGNMNDVRKAFQDAKAYPTPPFEPCKIEGTPRVRIGYIMLPATGRNGCLETRLLDSEAKNHPHTACVSAFQACCGFPAKPSNPYDKFRLRALLLSTIRTDPNVSLSGIWKMTDNPIDPSDAEFKWIADFLNVAFV